MSKKGFGLIHTTMIPLKWFLIFNITANLCLQDDYYGQKPTSFLRDRLMDIEKIIMAKKNGDVIADGKQKCLN